MNTLNRSDSSASFSLSSTSSRIIVDTREANAITIYADKEFGAAWSTFVMSVKLLTASASASADFSPARTIPAGGGVVTLSPSDMLGVEGIEIAWSSGAAEAAGVTARVIVTTEARVAPTSPTSIPNLGVQTFRAIAGTVTTQDDSPP